MNEQYIRIGLVGCGEIAQLVHLRLLPAMPGVCIAALAGGRPESVEQAAVMAPGAMKCESLATLLGRPELDAIVVTAPTQAHRDIACQVLESGRHLFLESPLADNLAHGQQIVEAWKKSQRVGMIGLPMHFHPLLVDLKRRLDQGEAGTPKAARMVFSTLPDLHADWTRDPDQGGGVLLHKASHEIATAQYLFGEVARVGCHAPKHTASPDSIAISLEFTAGPMVQIVSTTGSIEDRRIEVFGTEGKLSFGWYDSLNVSFQGKRADGVHGRLRRGLRELAGLPYLARKLRSPMNDPSFAAILSHFVACIRGDEPARPDLAEGLKCLAVIEAAQQSLETGAMTKPETIET